MISNNYQPIREQVAVNTTTSSCISFLSKRGSVVNINEEVEVNDDELEQNKELTEEQKQKLKEMKSMTTKKSKSKKNISKFYDDEEEEEEILYSDDEDQDIVSLYPEEEDSTRKWTKEEDQAIRDHFEDYKDLENRYKMFSLLDELIEHHRSEKEIQDHLIELKLEKSIETPKKKHCMFYFYEFDV